MVENRHASAVVLGDRGLLIAGASGAGKTVLALLLTERARASGRFGALVADDRTLVEASGGALVARCPPSIAGLAERRGAGPLPSPSIAAARLDAVVELVDRPDAPRLETDPSVTISGIGLPRLRLAGRDALAAALAVEAWRDNGFVTGG